MVIKIQKILSVIEIILIIFFPIFLGSLLVINPFYGDLNMIDEGQFAAWANHMLHGKQMYKDIYITYGPLFVYPMYITFKLFGPSAFLIRFMFATLSSILGILMTWLVIDKLRILRISKLLMLLCILIIPGMNIRMGLAFLEIFFLVNSYTKKLLYWDFLLGAFSIITFLISEETGLFSFLIIFLYYILLLLFSSNYYKVLKKIFAGLGGILLIEGLFSIWAERQGWLYDYIQVTKDVLLTFSGINVPNGQKFPNPLSTFPLNFQFFAWLKFVVSQDMLLYWELLLYISFFLYLFVRVLLRTFNKNDMIVTLVCFYGIFLYTTLIGRAGNFFLAFSPVIIIGTYFGEKIFRAQKKTHSFVGKTIARITIIVLVIFLLRIILIFRPHLSKIIQMPIAVFSAKHNSPRVGPLTISSSQNMYIKSLQEFVSANTSSKDTVFFFTDEPMMYMLVDRLNPTRFDLPFVANSIEKRFEVLNDLKQKPPKYIFYDSKAWAVDGVSNKRRLPEVYDYVKRHYSIEKNLGTVAVYKYSNKN